MIKARNKTRCTVPSQTNPRTLTIVGKVRTGKKEGLHTSNFFEKNTRGRTNLCSNYPEISAFKFAMNSPTAIVDMSREPVIVSFMDAKELFSPATIAVNPFLLLADATPDEATIPTCVDFGISLSAVQENAGDLDLYRAFVAKQMMLKMSVQGAVVYVVKLLGKEGSMALAFPSLVKQLLEEKKRCAEVAEAKEPPKEVEGLGEQAGKKEASDTQQQGTLQQSDIRQFSKKKQGSKEKAPRSEVKGKQILKKRAVDKKVKEPRRAAGVETEEREGPILLEPEAREAMGESSENSDQSQVRFIYSYGYIFINSVTKHITITKNITTILILLLLMCGYLCGAH